MIAYLLPFDKSEVYVRGAYLLPYWSKVAGLSFSIYAIMLLCQQNDIGLTAAESMQINCDAPCIPVRQNEHKELTPWTHHFVHRFKNAVSRYTSS